MKCQADGPQWGYGFRLLRAASGVYSRRMLAGNAVHSVDLGRTEPVSASINVIEPASEQVQNS